MSPGDGAALNDDEPCVRGAWKPSKTKACRLPLPLLALLDRSAPSVTFAETTPSQPTPSEAVELEAPFVTIALDMSTWVGVWSSAAAARERR